MQKIVLQLKIDIDIVEKWRPSLEMWPRGEHSWRPAGGVTCHGWVPVIQCSVPRTLLQPSNTEQQNMVLYKHSKEAWTK